jgi:choline dehydrogenase
LGRHLRSRRVTLLTNTTVTRVLVAGGVAVGVECVEGHVVNTIRVGQVILSAGAIYTPKILKCSGIGPEEELRRFDIEVAANSPEVGESLQDHPLVPVRAFCKGDLGYQAAAHGLGTIKAGLRYLITKSGPAAGNGIETVSYWILINSMVTLPSNAIMYRLLYHTMTSARLVAARVLLSILRFFSL